MLNEMAYITSRAQAWRWMLGCISTAFGERVAYELEGTFMDRRRLKVMLGLGAVLIMGTAGVYADLKPYQRERIRIAFHDAIHPGDATHVVRSGQGEMAVDAEESR